MFVPPRPAPHATCSLCKGDKIPLRPSVPHLNLCTEPGLPLGGRVCLCARTTATFGISAAPSPRAGSSSRQCNYTFRGRASIVISCLLGSFRPDWDSPGGRGCSVSWLHLCPCHSGKTWFGGRWPESLHTSGELPSPQSLRLVGVCREVGSRDDSCDSGHLCPSWPEREHLLPARKILSKIGDGVIRARCNVNVWGSLLKLRTSRR